MPDTPTEINDQILALHGWKKLPDAERERGWAIYENADGTETAAGYSLPDYTLCMESAWELVTEMIAAGCFVVVQSGNGIDDNDNDNMFTCVVYSDILLTKSGDEAPLAISEAYMAWKGIKK